MLFLRLSCLHIPVYTTVYLTSIIGINFNHIYKVGLLYTLSTIGIDNVLLSLLPLFSKQHLLPCVVTILYGRHDYNISKCSCRTIVYNSYQTYSCSLRLFVNTELSLKPFFPDWLYFVYNYLWYGIFFAERMKFRTSASMHRNYNHEVLIQATLVKENNTIRIRTELNWPESLSMRKSQLKLILNFQRFCRVRN